MTKILINLIFTLLNYAFIFSSFKYEEYKRFQDEIEEIHSIVLSLDGKFLATGSFATIKIWDCNTGQSKKIENVRFSNEGATYALMLLSQYPKDPTLLNHIIQSMAFAPDNSTIAYIYNISGCYELSELCYGINNYSLKICDLNTENITHLCNLNSNDYPIAYCNQATYLACGISSTLKIFDINPKSKTNRQCIKQFALANPITSLAYSPDDKSISIAMMGNSIKIMDLENISKTHSKEFTLFPGNKLERKHISYSESGKYLISTSCYKIIILDIFNNKTILKIDSPEKIKSAGFLTKSGSIFSLTQDGNCRISSLVLTNLGCVQLISNVICATASKDGKYIAILSGNGNIAILQIQLA